MEQYDVVIIGGSYAGVSAGLTLANAKRDIAIFDNQSPRNTEVTHGYNFPGHNGDNPETLLKTQQSELNTSSHVTWLNENVSSLDGDIENGFTISSKTNKVTARAIIFATGVYDELPAIDGITSFWKHNIFHCPYCSAPHMTGQPLAVYSTADEAFTLVQIIRKWTNDFALLTDNASNIDKHQAKQLQDWNVAWYPNRIQGFSGKPGESITVRFADNSSLNRRGIFMHLPFKQNASTLLQALGITVDLETALVSVSPFFETNIPGIYAIGDSAQIVQKVATAISSGTIAAIAIDKWLSTQTETPSNHPV